MSSSKTHSRRVGVQSRNNISLSSKYPSELLSKISTTINPTKSFSKTKSKSQKSKNSKVVPIGGGRKRTKTKKRRATKKNK